METASSDLRQFRRRPKFTDYDYRHPYTLSSNRGLESALIHIEGLAGDWRDVIDEYLNRNNNTIYRGKQNLSGSLAEVFLTSVLQQLAANTNSVRLNPISEDAITPSFKFRYSPATGNLVAFDRSTNSGFNEYDGVILADGLPTVFESKMSARRDGISKAIHGKLIHKSLLPLAEYFKTQTFGYVVMTPPEAIQDRNPFHNRFIESGGIFLRFPHSTHDYYDGVASFMQRRDICYSAIGYFKKKG